MPPRRKKVQDRWKAKEWYNIISPPYFGGVSIGSTPSDEPEKMTGRVVEATLYDITGDPSQQHMKMLFQVVNLKGDEAETIFKGHEYSQDYLKSLVKRRSTRIDGRTKVTTKDGYTLRMSIVLFSAMRVRNSQKTALRKTIDQMVEEKAKNLNFDQFVQEAVLGKIASDIYNEAKKIIPVRHIGVRKSKLLAYPGEKQEKNGAEIEVEA
ncbi:MAG: 30S ribosomal protein S3ae [Candidatus Bathyarchaeota archaeon]